MSVCNACALEKECMLKYDVSARMFCNQYIEKKLQTNADRIRVMTDDELAELVCDHACMLCPIKGCKGRMEEGRKKCKQRWLNWLKQEVDDA